MLATQVPLPIYPDRDGTPLDDGRLYFGLPNQNPVTAPQAVYWDAAGTQPAAQPISTRSGFAMRNGTPALVYASAAYSLLALDAQGRQVLYAPDSAVFDLASQFLALAGSGGSALVGFLQSGAGMVATTMQAKVREILSAKADVAAVGDGVTSDQTKIAAAVAEAFASSRPLYWPPGTYLSTATIPNFHDVEHWGPGIVKRGSDLFRITPKLAQTNNLYVSTTGVDTNDGLSAAQPLRTLQKVCDIIAEWAPRLPGRWVINMAAGTYAENVTFDSATEGEFPIDIVGPVVAHPTVPTAVISAVVTSSPCIQFNVGGWFRLTNVRMTGATTSDGVQTNGSRVTLTNVHVDACLNAAKGLNGSLITAVGGIWTGRGKAVAGGIGYQGLYCALHDIGGTSAVNATQIKDFDRGLLINEGGQGHLDFTQVSNCGTGLNIKRGAGAPNTDDMTIANCDVGVLVENNGWFNNNITFTGNTVNVRTLGGSPELGFLTSSNAARTMRVIESTNAAAWTGSVGESTRWTSPTMPNWVVSQSGHVARVTIWGVCTLTATCQLKFYLYDGTTDTLIGTINLASAVTIFTMTATVWHSGSSNQRSVIESKTGGGTVVAVTNQGSVALKDKSFSLKWKATLGNAADSITLEGIVFEGTYGG